MDDYIKMWIDIIENMSNDNTYKLAWGRAIIEIIAQSESNRIKISFDEISKKMLKYYWNQLFFFKLKQGPSKTPTIVQVTEKCIKYFTDKQNTFTPVWYDYAETVLKQDYEFYNSSIKEISRTLKQDVSWRFKNCKSKTLEIYELDLTNKIICFKEDNIIKLKEHAFILSQLLNYRWSQLLEKFNNSPRIISKVKGISENKLRRRSLKNFKEALMQAMQKSELIDFYTGDLLNEDDVSVDHVIPWSFMYSDDIWNLVITSKSNNSKKSNSIPSNEIIQKLKKRNHDLYAVLSDTGLKADLKIAIENNYVEKFYTSLRM